MKKIFRKWMCLLLGICMVSGCSEKTQDRTFIAYTVYPIGYLLNVIGGVNLPIISIQDEDSLVQEATLVQDYKNILSISQAFFHIGNLEPYMNIINEDISVSGTSEQDLSAMNTVYDFGRYTATMFNGEVTYIKSEYYDDPVMDTIDVDEKDLYLWNDPITMLSMGKDICAYLSEVYPEQQELYEANLDSLENDLINLDAQFQVLASKIRNDSITISFVSMTPSFGCWQRDYGFEVYPIVLSKFGVLPTDEQLSVMERTIMKEGVEYIVHEENLSEEMEALYQRVKNDLNLKEISLYNLSSLSEESRNSGMDYLTAMYANLNTIEELYETLKGAEVSDE